MTKTTNVFIKILQAVTMVLISCAYFSTGGSVIISLISCVLLGTIAYQEDYLVTAVNALIVLLSMILLSVQNVYIDLLKVIIDTLTLTLAGCVIGIMLKNGKKHFSIIVATTLSKLLVTLLSLLMVKRAGDDIFSKLVEQPLMTYFDYAMYAILQSGVYNAETLEILKEMIDGFISTISTFMPAILIIISVLSSYLFYVFTKKTIEISMREKLCVESFSHLKINRKVTLAFFVFIILSLFIPPSVISDAISNILVIFFFAYFMCGISVIDFYFKKTKIWWWVRTLIYLIALTVLSIFVSIAPLLLIIVAMIDARRDFRKLNVYDMMVEIKDDEDES